MYFVIGGVLDYKADESEEKAAQMHAAVPYRPGFGYSASERAWVQVGLQALKL